MYSYQVVWEKDSDDKTKEVHEYIVANSFEDVFNKVKIQKDENFMLVAIVRRNPIVCVINKEE